MMIGRRHKYHPNTTTSRCCWRFIVVSVVFFLVVTTTTTPPPPQAGHNNYWWQRFLSSSSSSSSILLTVNAQETSSPSSPTSSLPPSSSEQQQQQQQEQLSRPRYTLEPLNFSVSYRQNVCDRNAAFQNGTVLLEDTLRGLQLRPYFLAGTGSLSAVEQDGSILPNSYAPSIRILDTLAVRAGFSWRDSYGSSNINQALVVNSSSSNTTTTTTTSGGGGGGGSGGPFTLDPLLAWGVQSFDMVATESIKTVERAAAGGAFLEGHIDSSIIMVGMGTTEPEPLSLFGFLRPFEWQVWLLTVLTMVLAGVVYQWMERINVDSDRQELGDKPTETIYFAALSFFSDIKFEPSTNYTRMFVLTLAFWGMILSSAYTANLASWLVARNAPTLQVETVGDAVAANMPLCTLRGTPTELEILKAYPNANLVSINVTNPNDLYLSVIAGKCTLAVTTLWQWDMAQRDGTANVGCQLKWIGRIYKFAKSSFVVYSDSGILCTNLIKDVLSLHITRMLDEGVIDQILDEYLQSIQTIDCKVTGSGSSSSSGNDDNNDGENEGDSDGSSSSNGSSGDSVYALTLQDLGGLFIVVYVSGAISCVAALIAWYRKKRISRLSNEVGAQQQPDPSNNVLPKSTTIDGIESNLRLHEEDQQQIVDGINNSIDVEVDGNGNCSGDGWERDELVSKLNVMRQELEGMQSILLKKKHR